MKAAIYSHSFTFSLIILCTFIAGAMKCSPSSRLLSYAIDKRNPILCHTIPLCMCSTLITEHTIAENKVIHINIVCINNTPILKY